MLGVCRGTVAKATWNPRSKAEARVNGALHAVGSLRIIHEYDIGERLRLDFYLPDLAMAVEVHGDQHFKPNAFFFEDGEARKAARARDERKAELCATHRIILVTLTQDEVMDSLGPSDLFVTIMDRYKKAQNASQEAW